MLMSLFMIIKIDLGSISGKSFWLYKVLTLLWHPCFDAFIGWTRNIIMDIDRFSRQVAYFESYDSDYARTGKSSE